MTIQGERVIDYIAVCGLDETNKSDNRSTSEDVSYLDLHPCVLDRFPTQDYVERALPLQLPMCCMPFGVELRTRVQSVAKNREGIRTYPVVLTEGDGSKTYASCLVFFDRLPDSLQLQSEELLGGEATKCICIVSRWPFLRTFQAVLRRLYSAWLGRGAVMSPQDMFSYLLHELVLPSPGGQVRFQVEGQPLRLVRPAKEGQPFWREMSLQPLLRSLGVSNLLLLYRAVLLEQRVLLRGSHFSLLTAVAEGLTALLAPLPYVHVYAPVLPTALVDFVEAPTPFLMGLHSSVDVPATCLEGVVVASLDDNTVSGGESLPPLPDKEGKSLKDQLRATLVPDAAFGAPANRSAASPSFGTEIVESAHVWGINDEAEVREAFWNFLKSLLEGYEEFVVRAEPCESCTFDAERFLSLKLASGRPIPVLLQQLLETQSFLAFIDEQDPADTGSVWLRTPLKAKMESPNRDTCPTIDIGEPYTSALAATMPCFRYETFPRLNLNYPEAGTARDLDGRGLCGRKVQTQPLESFRRGNLGQEPLSMLKSQLMHKAHLPISGRKVCGKHEGEAVGEQPPHNSLQQ
eukprot:jgi/Botrbrau1/17687/Bobra.0166s0111.1